MRALVPRLALAVLLSTAACQTQVDTAGVDKSILGGTTANVGDFPTVVGIVISQGSRGLCTGTQVAPDLILTAAHCVSPTVLGFASQEQVTAETVVFFDSTNLGANGSAIAAVETIPHPSWRQPGDPDVGLIRLGFAKEDRTPSPINFDAAAVPSGTSLDMVGYGVADDGNAGRLFHVQDTTTSCSASGVSDSTFLCFNQQDGTGKCSGDSGGPSFLAGTNTVVGITSFGDQNCQFFGADMRTDASADFLMSNAPELLCGADGTCGEGCGNLDPDCCTGDECDNNGGLGSLCGGGQPECLVGFCASGPDGMRCTQDCNIEANDCPEGFDCLSTGGGGGACWPADDGGCNASGSSAGGFGLLVLLALVAVRRRRRASVDR